MESSRSSPSGSRISKVFPGVPARWVGVVFIVEKGQLGLAIGSKAKNLVKLRTLLKKTVKLVEYDDDEKRFIFNLCKPYKVKDVHLEETTDGFVGKISVEPSDKSKLIGKSGANIDLIRKMAHRHHAVKDIQIL